MATKAKSIRAPVAVWEACAAEAEARGVTVNALVVALISEGLTHPGTRTPAQPKPAAPSEARKAEAREALEAAEAKAAHLGAARRAAAPSEKGEAMGYSIQIGPSPSVPGSRLKGARRTLAGSASRPSR